MNFCIRYTCGSEMILSNVHPGIPFLKLRCTKRHVAAAAAAAKSLQLCPTLCNPIDGSPPGTPIPGVFQARVLEWVAISFSSAWKWKVSEVGSVLSDSSQPHGPQPTRLLHPWDFPGKSTGVGCHCLLHKGLWENSILLANTESLHRYFLKSFLEWVCLDDTRPCEAEAV